MPMLRPCLFLAVSAWIGSQSVAAQPPARSAEMQLLLRHATVLPMTDDTAAYLQDQAVLVRGDTIVWVGPDADRPAAPAAREVDLRGRYVMPGLVDMHVHLSESHLPLFLGNGVTSVREMNGSPGHLRMRDRIEAGELGGPRMSVSSPLLTGQSWSVRHVIVPDPDSARSLVKALGRAGYDWIKIYDGLSADTWSALVETARDQGLPLTGHIPESVGLEGVLAAGQNLEHVEKIGWATVGMNPDPRRIPDIVRAVSAAGVSLTATLWSQRILTAAGTTFYDSLFARPETRLVSGATRGWWASLRSESPRPEHPEGRGARLYAWQSALVLALKRAGVPILPGTDTPNPLLVPGFSLHDEIAALVEAGLPVYDVLHAGTAVAGRVLVPTGGLGVVEAGARADLLVVSADPVTTPATLRTPEAVIVRGRLYRREALEAMREGRAPPDATGAR